MDDDFAYAPMDYNGGKVVLLVIIILWKIWYTAITSMIQMVMEVYLNMMYQSNITQ